MQMVLTLVHLLLHHLLRSQMAHGLGIGHSARHALASNMLHHARMMLSSGTHLRSRLHADHGARLAHVRRARHAWVHLHGLSPMSSGCGHHAGMAVHGTRVAAASRPLGLIGGHHFAALDGLSTAAARAEAGGGSGRCCC